MRRLDDFIIDRVFQPIADRLARYWSCYAIAAFILTGFDLEHAAFYIYKEDYVWIAVAAMWLAPMTYRAYQLESQPVRNVLPLERIQFLALRLLNAAFTPFVLLAVFLLPVGIRTIDDIGWAAMVVALYLMACRKNPPRQQRAKAPAFAVSEQRV